MPCDECEETDVPTTLVAIKDGKAPTITIDDQRMSNHMVGSLCPTCIEKIRAKGHEIFILPPGVAAQWMKRSKAVGGTSLSPELSPTAQLFAGIAADTFISATKAWVGKIDNDLAEDVFDEKIKAALSHNLTAALRSGTDKWDTRRIWMGGAAMCGIDACLEYLRRIGK